MVLGQYKAIMPLYNLKKMEIWLGVTNPLQKDGQTSKDRATQLLTKYKSGALVTQSRNKQKEI